MEDNREERDKERRRGNLVYRSGDNDTIVNLMRVEFEVAWAVYSLFSNRANRRRHRADRTKQNKTITDT